MDYSSLRQLFPVTREMTFLNNAAESPLNLRVRQRLEEYLDIASRTPHRRPSVRDEVRNSLSKLLGGNPEEYALTTSTGMGIGIAASGYAWKAGDNVVIPAEEHWNNTFPWLALRERGVEVRIVPIDTEYRFRPSLLAACIDDRTRMVSVAAVRHSSGYRANLREISHLARSHGALFVVDGIQAAGVVPLHVEEDGIDVLACAGFKWLLGLPGTGFLYVRKEAMEKINPVLPGMFSAENNLQRIDWLPDARRYETGSIAYSLFHAWTAGLELLQEIGINVIHKRVLSLTSRLIEGFHARNIPLLTPTERLEERSAILAFTLGSREANKIFCQGLIEKGILITLRGESCRVSPSFYNTEEETDRFLSFLPKK